jgi:DNA-binding NarL/FixJ family response regulator
MGMSLVRIVLADDHRIVREGLRTLIAQEPDMTVVAMAEDGPQLLRQVQDCSPDLVITDISMPGLNGIEALRRLRAEQPEVQVVCLSMHNEDRVVLSAIEAGASGYLLKDSSFDELAQAVRQVMAGRVYVSAELSGVMVRELRSLKAGAAPAPAGAALTPREKELVQLFAEGWTTNEIAERLHLSPKTVATHRENVLRKLQARGVADLTRYALREGLSSIHANTRRGAAETA